MKIPKSTRACKTFRNVVFRHENETLTSFAGLAIVHAWLRQLGLAESLRGISKNKDASYPLHRIFLLLVVFRIMGFRRLREAEPYRTDPLLLQTVGLKQMPDISTIGRQFSGLFDQSALERIRKLNRSEVVAAAGKAGFSKWTLDFDGSVFRTRRKAENTAVGYNTQRKGERSYYPLFCTLAQTAQVYDVLHRPGNVHDSNQAAEFMKDCILSTPKDRTVEIRADAAFFSESIIDTLDPLCTYTISMPFLRFPELKEMVETRTRWKRMSKDADYFELKWKPQCWAHKMVRLIAVRRVQPTRRIGPLQLDLFEPRDFEYTYSMVATNGQGSAQRLVQSHAGRGAQEGLLGELKNHLHADAVVFKTQQANAGSMWSSIFAHNLLRRIQIELGDPVRGSGCWKRPSLWVFKKAKTLRSVICRAGRILHPKNMTEMVIGGEKRDVEILAGLMPYDVAVR